MNRDKIAEVEEQGFCVLRSQLAATGVEACRDAYWPRLLAYVESHEPNRGPRRHFLPMSFDAPCFSPEFFFDPAVLGVVRGAMDDGVVADQWGCDVALPGSEYQGVHVDYQRPLFAEAPDLPLPAYALVVSFGLERITAESGPIEIAPGTHRMPRVEALATVTAGAIGLEAVSLELGDVLIRHPWALHRGSPNRTSTPRALVSIRYVRRWYADDSRDVEAFPRAVWDSLTEEQRRVLRFPVRDR
jgi:ectoine hydroxylase-related dioxygenase (phytanoyl-CoA dioxygenase family)